MMKKAILLLTLVSVTKMASAASSDVQPAAPVSAAAGTGISVSVHSQDARGVMYPVGSGVTHGEPIIFAEDISYPVNTNGGPRDQFDGSWSLTVSNVRDSLADSVAFDVTLAGKNPGIWEGQVVRHVETGTGSRTGVVHWLDGKDYVITVHRVNG